MVRIVLTILFFGVLHVHAQFNQQSLLKPTITVVVTPVDTIYPSNLVGWWRADTLVTLNGSGVSGWKSIVGLNNSLINVTPAEQPPFVTGVYNGKPTVRFSSVSHNLQIQSGAQANNILVSSTLGTAITVFLVGKNAVNNDGNLFGTYNGGGWMIFGNANRAFGAGLNSATTPQAPSITPVSSSLVLMEFTMTSTQTVTYANGVQTGNVSGTTNIYSGGVVAIGRYSGTVGKGLTSYDVSEIIVYNKILSATERADVEYHLKTKYGL